MTKTIYTAGYTSFNREDFVNILKAHHINALIDVRSKPFSEYNPEYNKPELEAFMTERGIYYRNYAREFGARQEDRAFYDPEGWLDFEKFAASPQFREGVSKLCEGMKQGYTFVLMCAEKNPANCHRAILVSRAFHELGYEVIHLMPEGHNFTQSDLEEQMLGLDNIQLDLFRSREEQIRDAYRERNRKIGWRIDSQKEGD